MTEGFPLLGLLVGWPLAAAALLGLVPDQRWARVVALAAALIEVALALVVVALFDRGQGGFQMVERAAWIPALNVHWKLGVDGLSVLFLPLTALLFLGVVVAGWNSVRVMCRLHFALLLMLEGVTLGIFCALDTVLFFLFWELTLIPIYFLVGLWGIGPNRRHAASKYTLLMLGGGLPLLFGFVLIAFDQAATSPPGGLVFDLETLLAHPLPAALQYPVFALLLLGFAVKTPVFPLHTWLPTLAMEGPASVAAVMTGVKLGAYGIIRFVVPLAPEAAQDFHWLLAGLGAVGIIYGGLGALVQTNLRRMLAYSSVSHVGLVVLGIASFDMQGLQGAVFQLLNFTVVAGGIFLMAGFLQHRFGSTDLASLGGLARAMPLAASFFLLLGLAGMGVPATSGFAAEHLILLSALKAHTGAGFAALGGVIIGAGYFLGFYRRAFLGPVRNEAVAAAIDLRPREMAIVAVLAALVLAFGLWPALILDTTRAAAEVWLGRLGGP
ncbi:MAG: NADH-quinone oxidoreductase subunit M [Alphaproteobacteria bacterium]|nr:NADH-quinone oxidoreductase subunit M [Alphaproteobacteria bacterium]